MSYRTSYSQREESRGGRGGGVSGGGGGMGSSSNMMGMGGGSLGGAGSFGGNNNMMAGSSSSGNNANEDSPPMSRLFVICSKVNTEQDIRDAFEKFGDIEDVWVVQNKQTGENKGEAFCWTLFVGQHTICWTMTIWGVLGVTRPR